MEVEAGSYLTYLLQVSTTHQLQFPHVTDRLHLSNVPETARFTHRSSRTFSRHLPHTRRSSPDATDSPQFLNLLYTCRTGAPHRRTFHTKRIAATLEWYRWGHHPYAGVIEASRSVCRKCAKKQGSQQKDGEQADDRDCGIPCRKYGAHL